MVALIFLYCVLGSQPLERKRAETNGRIFDQYSPIVLNHSGLPWYYLPFTLIPSAIVNLVKKGRSTCWDSGYLRVLCSQFLEG